MREGGDIAKDLNGLYEYMTFRLIDANVRADLTVLEEVEHLLKELKSAWDSIGKLTLVKDPVVEDPTSRTAISYGKA